MAQTKLIVDPWVDLNEQEPEPLTREELAETIMRLVDVVDSFFPYAAFEFLYREDCESNFVFEDEIEPRIEAKWKRMQRRLSLLRETLKGDEQHARNCLQLSDDVFTVINRKRHESFGLGILMGAKLQGASKERLRELAHGWIRAGGFHVES